MFSKLRAVTALAALLTPLTFGAPAAHAGTVENIAVEGSGTISPGLPCPRSGCAIHLDFSAVFTGDVAVGTSACTFDGTDTFPGGATILQGQGAGDIACSGTVSASGTVNFTRAGTVVDVTGCVWVNGTYVKVHVVLHFVGTPPPPIVSFTVTGGGSSTPNC